MKRTALLLVFLITASVPAATAQLRKAERALKNQEFGEAYDLVQARLVERPEDHKAYDLLARIHRAQAEASEGEEYLNHWAEMVAAYRKILEHAPSRDAEITRTLLLDYQEVFGDGAEFFNAGVEEADAEAQAALFIRSAEQFHAAAIVMPDSLDPHLNWAFANIRGDNGLQAIEPLQRAIEIGPVEVEWFRYLSHIYLGNERSEDAVALLEGAVESFGQDEELQGLLLNAYALSGQNDRAIARYRERAKAMPDDRLTRYNLGSLLLQAEHYDEAIEHLAAAVALDHLHGDSHYNLGAAYINKATDVQRQAVALDEALRAARDTLSQDEIEARQEAVFALDGEKKALMAEAIPYLERARLLALAEGNDDSGICRALYQAYAQTNMMDKVEEVKDCAGF